MKKLVQKIKEKTGESLAETLASLLIICMGLTILPGAVVAASRINKQADEAYVYMDAKKGSTEEVDGSMVLLNETEEAEIEVMVRKDTYGKHTFYWYHMKPAGSGETSGESGD